MKLSEILKKFEAVIPLSLQDSWDRSGLQVGSRKQDIRKILFAYDASHEVVRYAAKIRANLIVTHHPLRLSDYRNIDCDTYDGQTVALAIKNDIAIYSAHTSHDASLLSLNREYASKLKLKNIGPIVPAKGHTYLKLVIFVPVTHTQKVLEAMFQAGAGHIGHYSHCSFRTQGAGTFKGDNSTHPYLGKKGTLEEAVEDKLEVITPRDRLKSALNAMMKAHPYEEVAYDIIPLENDTWHGSGIWGMLDKEITLKNLIPVLKKLFRVKTLRVAGDNGMRVKTVAICTGSGASLLPAVIKQGFDCFITGDVKYHAAVDALRADTALIDVGHYASEIRAVDSLMKIFGGLFSGIKLAKYGALKDAMRTA